MTEPDPTEALLRSMVAECGDIIRLHAFRAPSPVCQAEGLVGGG